MEIEVFLIFPFEILGRKHRLILHKPIGNLYPRAVHIDVEHIHFRIAAVVIFVIFLAVHTLGGKHLVHGGIPGDAVAEAERLLGGCRKRCRGQSAQKYHKRGE